MPLPPMGRRQEAGERSPTRQKISVFDKREQRKLACYAERTTDDKPSAEKACILCRGAKEEDRRSTDVWIYTNRTNNGETST